MSKKYLKISEEALDKLSSDLYLSGDRSNRINGYGYASHIHDALRNFIYAVQDENKTNEKAS